MTPLSRQALFNKMVRGLHRQGWKRAMNAEGACLYRAPESRKCAIGHCIPDARYTPDMDTPRSSDPWARVKVAARIAPDDGGWACTLRMYHDQGRKPAQMRRNFARAATVWGLSWPAGVPWPRGVAPADPHARVRRFALSQIASCQALDWRARLDVVDPPYDRRKR